MNSSRNIPQRIGELWRLPRVMAETGMSRAWLYKASKRGKFPRPMKNGRSTVWSSLEVENYKRALFVGEKWHPGWMPNEMETAEADAL